jgi:hypothetical protein
MRRLQRLRRIYHRDPPRDVPRLPGTDGTPSPASARAISSGMDATKPAALNRLVDIANQLQVGNPNARTLVRDLFAAFTEVMAHFEAPQPLATLSPEPGTTYLVFSPHQDGWNLGQFRNGRWTDANLSSRPLIPTHWLRLPADPSAAVVPAAVTDEAPSQMTVGVSLLITRAQKVVLRERGFSDEEIRHMKPGEAHNHLRLTA